MDESSKMSRKKAALMGEVIVLMLFLILLFPASEVLGGLMDAILFKDRKPDDFQAMQFFNNLVDEINDLVSEDSVYNDKKVQMYLPEGYAVTAYNADTGQITESRPEECGADSCICIEKPGDIHDCRIFSKKIRFYSYRYYSAVSMNNPYQLDSWEKTSYSFGSDASWNLADDYLDLANFDMITGSNVNLKERKVLKFQISEDGLRPDKQLTRDVEMFFIFGYSSFYISGDYENKGYRGNLYIDKVDNSKLKKNSNDENSDENSDKNSDENNDEIYVFIVPFDGVNGVSYDLYEQKGGISEYTSPFFVYDIGDYPIPVVSDKGGAISHLELRKRMFSLLKEKDEMNYAMILTRNQDKEMRLRKFIEYFIWSVNPLLFDVDKARRNIAALGVEALGNAKELVDERIDRCNEKYDSQMLARFPGLAEECLSYYGECEIDAEESGMELFDPSIVDEDYDECREFIRLENYYINDFCDKSVFNKNKQLFISTLGKERYEEIKTEKSIVNCADLLKPEIMSEFLARFMIQEFNQNEANRVVERGSLFETEGKYDEAYDAYIEFLAKKDGKDFDALSVKKKYPGLGFLEPALELRQGKVTFVKKRFDDSNLYLIEAEHMVIEADHMRYIFVPAQYVVERSYFIKTDDEIDFYNIDLDKFYLINGVEMFLDNLEYYAEDDKESLYLVLELMRLLESQDCISIIDINSGFFQENFENCMDSHLVDLLEGTRLGQI